MKMNLLHGALALFVTSLTACAAQTTAPDQATGVGTAQFALTGALPGVTHLTLSIYDGAISDINAQSPTFQPIACAAYAGAGGNKIKLQYLKASSNYTLFVELFGDDKCQKRVGFGWRGRVEVVGGNDLADVVPTYYVQPYLFGAFTGLAPVTADLQTAAKALSCSNESDCKSVHVNATCDSAAHRCVVDDLFPLDGYKRRGFANSVALADGSVAIFGGLSVPKDTNWEATASSGSSTDAEIFDPQRGYFYAVNESALTGVGLANAVTDGASAVAIVGGASDTGFALVPGKSLTTTVDATGCPTTCPVTNLVQRWDLGAQTLAQLPLTTAQFGTLPIVSRVHVKEGDRLLIAGGTSTPITKTVDTRLPNAVLCDLTKPGVITCATNTGTGHSPGAERANAATACLSANADGTCTKLLILGGRKTVGKPLAEIYDATTNTFVPVSAESSVTTQIIHGGKLIKLSDAKFLLLGASVAAPFLEDDVLTAPVGLVPPSLLTLDQTVTPPKLQLAPVPMGTLAAAGSRILATSIALANGGALLIGGLDANLQPVNNALLFDGNGLPVGLMGLASPRIGGNAALIGGKTPLAGCVLLSGGFTTDATGAVTPQNHVETFCTGP